MVYGKQLQVAGLDAQFVDTVSRKVITLYEPTGNVPFDEFEAGDAVVVGDAAVPGALPGLELLLLFQESGT